eukprot:586584_1
MSSDAGKPQVPAEAKKDMEERPLRYAKYADIACKDVCGSTAGAGSGDFHEYRHIRRKNMVREERMEAEYQQAKAQDAFQDRQKFLDEQSTEMTSKKAAKRRRKKQRKIQAKMEKLQKLNKFEQDGSFMDKFLAEQKDKETTVSREADALQKLKALEDIDDELDAEFTEASHQTGSKSETQQPPDTNSSDSGPEPKRRKLSNTEPDAKAQDAF